VLGWRTLATTKPLRHSTHNSSMPGAAMALLAANGEIPD
jgi:hypothetical protein